MTRKIILLAIGYVVTGVLTFTACEVFTFDTSICDIEFAGLNSLAWRNSVEPDSITSPIGFELSSWTYEHTCYRPTLQVFPSAYAASNCAKFRNRLLPGTYQILLDKPMVIGSDTIAPLTDLLGIPEVRALTEINIEKDCHRVYSTIIFKPELARLMHFEQVMYRVTFICATDDSRVFVKYRWVRFVT